MTRSTTELTLALERAVRRTASAEWITGELAAAVEARDSDRAAMLLALADELGRQVEVAEAEALVASRSNWGAFASDCAACMADVGTCPSARALAACAIPFELSPLGDANALRRAGTALALGEPVDRLDAGLAAIGLGATMAVVVTGGTSAGVKAGAGLMRMARRMGTLPPSLVRLARLALTDGAARVRLAEVAGDLDRVRAATGPADALRLVRFVEGPEDAARLARLAEAAGPRAERTVAVLGKARAFRATVRISRAVATTLALLWICVLQLCILIATHLGGAVWRSALNAVDRAATDRHSAFQT